jgi:hypothetical protein
MATDLILAQSLLSAKMAMVRTSGWHFRKLDDI